MHSTLNLEFEPDKACLHVTHQEEEEIKIRLSSWSDGLIVEHWLGQWLPCYDLPDLSLLAQRQTNSVIDQFLMDVPKKFLDIASRFDYLQLAILRMLRLAPSYIELVESIPVLAWLLAEKFGTAAAAGRGSVDYELLCRMKRTRLLTELGFTGSKSNTRFLQKITPLYYNINEMRGVWKILNTPRIFQHFRHMPRILHTHLDVAVRPIVRFMQYKFFKKLLMEEDKNPLVYKCATMIEDVTEMGTILKKQHVAQTLRHIRDTDHLEKLHDRWQLDMLAERNRQKKLELAQPFPPPPFPGNDFITPVCNLSDLYDLSDRMSNCVASYAKRIKRGEVYIYETSQPEACTVSIILSEGKARVGEMSLVCNAEPAQSTWDTVKKWLANQV